MPGVVPDQGEVQMLAMLLGLAGQEPELDLRLYVNDRVPGIGDVLTDYDEMSDHGYAPIALPPSAWAVQPAQPGTNTPALGRGAAQVFHFGAAGPPVLVYGYLIVAPVAARLWVAERFADGPYRVQNAGDEVTVEPTFSLRSEYP